METEDKLSAPAEMAARRPQGSFLEVLRVFAKLGLTSFGGPVALAQILILVLSGLIGWRWLRGIKQITPTDGLHIAVSRRLSILCALLFFVLLLGLPLSRLVIHNQGLALFAFALLVIWKLPPWSVVLISAVLGSIIPLLYR